MIELNNITKKFTLHNQGKTNILVFKNLNLKINPGEIVALTGPSGVGKSRCPTSWLVGKTAGRRLARNATRSILSRKATSPETMRSWASATSSVA